MNTKENKNSYITYVQVGLYEFIGLSITVFVLFFLFLMFSASSRYIINLFI